MIKEVVRPIVFISYSWKPEANKEKVHQLAERLELTGVTVIIDSWNLTEGQDTNLFMEQMVNSADVKRVLLICNKDYVEKANQRTGGVGKESMIVSQEIYSHAKQTKFIPIIFEKNEENVAYLPAFINSRFYIDLSDDDIFEVGFEALLRNIFDKPVSQRPPSGPPPAYILNDNPVFLPTAHKVPAIKKALQDEKRNAILLIQDYYDSFIIGLGDFKIEESVLTEDNYDEVISKSINDLAIMRDDFMYFIDSYCTYSVEIDIDKLHSFFEQLLDFLLNLDGIANDSRTFSSIKNDNFRFVLHELFLYFAAKMVEKKRFTEFGYILNNPFIIKIERHYEMRERYFYFFRSPVSSHELRNKKLHLNRVNVTADLLKERATGKISFKHLQEVDALLYYVSLFHPDQSGYRYLWYPITTCYDFYTISLMKRAISKKFFDKIKAIFDVTSKEELLVKVEIAKERDKAIERFNYNFQSISIALEMDELCSIS